MISFENPSLESLGQLAVVGLNGIGPSTSPLSGVRSNQLSYRPTAFFADKTNNLCGHFKK